MKKLIARLRRYYFYVVFGLLFFLMYLGIQKLLRKGKMEEAHQYRKKWAIRILKACRLKPEIMGNTDFDTYRAYIVCANHASYLDIVLLCACLPLNFGFMAKAEVRDYPLFKDFFKELDIAVERENATNAAQSFRSAIRLIRSGRSLVIFPEGGIFSNPYQLHELKNGAFELAIRLTIPVIAVCLPDNMRILPDSKNYAESGKIRLILHQPIEPEGMNVDELKTLVHKLIQDDLNKYAR